MRHLPSVVLISALAAAPVLAQSEAALKDAFEGKHVVVRIDMPGSDDGVDVYPGEPRPIDFTRHGERLKLFGTALRAGDSAMVTKVRVKKDLIEFQLNGGGYGTLGDDTTTHTYIPSSSKSRREEDLDRAIKNERDPATKKALEKERNRLRDERNQRDAANRASAEVTSAIKEQAIADKRLRGGSRFNVRYRNGLPGAVLLPEGLMATLAEYVDFGGMTGRALAAPGARPGAAGVPVPPPTAKRDLKVGMTPLEVMDALGRPQSETTFDKITRWTYPDLTVIFENGRLKEVKF